MKNKHSQNRLLLLIVVSACVHALFLYQPVNKIELPSQQGANFTVQLQTIYPKPRSNAVANSEKKLATKKVTKQDALKNPATMEAEPNTQHTSQQETTAKSPPSSDAIRATLLTQIKTKFTKHFHYPQFAQRKGWQGKVLLAFNINQQGNISDIHIKDSSGYAVLDQAAHHSLSQIKQITVNNWPFSVKQAFKLPIIYKLYEG